MPQARRAAESVEGDPRETILQLVNGGAVSQCVYVAAKLGIADFLADGPKTCDELAVETNVHGPSLYRLMRALASLGIFHEDGQGRFALTPLSEPLRSDVAGSLRDWAVLRGEDFVWQPWGAVLESVRTGSSAFRQVFRAGPFEYLQNDADAARIFGRGMQSISSRKFVAVAAAYDFSGIRTLVDVGGGTGGLLAAILTANPDMKGVLADLAHVVAQARREIDQAGLSGRCRCVEADMFESVPEGGDALILGNVIHGWDDEHSIQILKNCRRAVRAGARLLLVEFILGAPNEPHLGRLADIEMLVMTDGGRERSASEFGALYEAAGFRLSRALATESPWSVVEGTAV
jgi:SAM-dependent methyltransferase